MSSKNVHLLILQSINGSLVMRSFFTVTCMSISSFALANPQGFQPMSGKASLINKGAHVLEITADDNAIIHWDSFSIDSHETTYFHLPSARSRVLNRVTGDLFSEIYGNLKSNGEVFLINTKGIFIGVDAKVNMTSFIASSFDFFDSEFLKGKEKLSHSEGGAVINLGTIQTSGGDVKLIGARVVHLGEIEALQTVERGGRITLVGQQGNVDVGGNLIAVNGDIRIEGKQIMIGGEDTQRLLKADTLHINAEEDLAFESVSILCSGSSISTLRAERGCRFSEKTHIQIKNNLLISANDDLLFETNSLPIHIETEIGSLSLSSNEMVSLEGNVTLSSGGSFRLIAGGPLTIQKGKILCQGDFFSEADTIEIDGRVASQRGNLEILTCDLTLHPEASICLVEGDGFFRATVDDCGSLILAENASLSSGSLGVMSIVVNGDIEIENGSFQSYGDIDIVADGEIAVMGPKAKLFTTKGNINLYTQEHLTLSEAAIMAEQGNLDLFALDSIYVENGEIAAEVPSKGYLRVFAGKDILFDAASTVHIRGEDCLALFVADHSCPKTAGPGTFSLPSGATITMMGSGCLRIYTSICDLDRSAVQRISTEGCGDACHEAHGIYYPMILPHPQDGSSGFTIYYKGAEF